MAGYSGTPLRKKLGIRDSHRVGWDGAPSGFAARLDLPPSVIVDLGLRGERSYDVVIAFVTEAAALARAAERFRPLLKWSGGLWLAWPKQSSPLAGELQSSIVRRVGLEAGLVDNKVCAIDSDWSGLRFVWRKSDRPSEIVKGVRHATVATTS